MLALTNINLDFKGSEFMLRLHVQICEDPDG